MTERVKVDPILLKVPQVAELIGLSRSQLYEMMARNEIPGVVRIGRSVRISRKSLERWIAEQAGEAVQSAEDHAA